LIVPRLDGLGEVWMAGKEPGGRDDREGTGRADREGTGRDDREGTGGRR